MPQPVTLKKLKLNGSMKTYKTFLKKNVKNNVLFTIGDCNAKVGSQEIPGITGKFGLAVQNEAGQRLTEFCQENMLVIANTLSQPKDDTTHGYHQMVNAEMSFIVFFAAKDGEALYSW